ncbi:NTP transferase domain-containing protein [Nocardioides sp. zg-1308]|uniref:Sugar phosphate nucleotidyltransferase n=1 Tax=Nocardioides renjunii TaxID=3095075 RepID=A0ABU5KB04_9ACTN|nr:MULTISPECIES: sugar phosphate nucleotidyltransferase [unclassified Nocardioides]MDZ5661614.1 sugar phosphate nucleotidyltransferase [Nocardioides sp. S-58]NPD04719.1 NTP transferase domain-containing protein [Nocardioides sp. zg-1308]WQQ22612.1 sugar phosphate nucleotidyltransferase [Nocardioides sp. S-34]
MTDTSDEPVAVILAGGQGSRLWPISRDRAPKQFQPVVRDRPLLTGTIERLSEIVDPRRIHVSTRARFADAARANLGPVPAENLILEEDPAGPATAFALSVATLTHLYGNAPALIAPSDHLINEEEAFNAASRDMLAQLEKTPESMVVLGAEPSRYDPSLGYIHTKDGDGSVEVIDSFHEKPDQELVDELSGTGSLYWNTACYGVRVGQACEAYRTALPLIFDSIERFARSQGTDQAYRGATIGGHEIYPLMWAGMECLVVPRRLGWTDVGTWTRLERVLHDQRVTSIGPALQLDAEDVLVASMDGRPVVTLGARGLIVVTHEDAVYVLDKKKALDTPTLERLRSLLAASTREDLL